MSKTSLTRRLAGGTLREHFRPPNTRLTQLEVAILIQEVLKLDAQGYGPSLDTVTDIASSICQARGGPKVGMSWAGTFIKRTPELATKWGRVYECQRRLCEDPEIIRA